MFMRKHVEVIEEEQLTDNSRTPVRGEDFSDDQSGQKHHSLISISEEPSFRENDVSMSHERLEFSSYGRKNRWDSSY